MDQEFVSLLDMRSYDDDNDDDVSSNSLQRSLLKNLLSMCIYVQHIDPALDCRE
jgi:hypothetical protein